MSINYDKIIRNLEAKLARQEDSILITKGQIEGFRALQAREAKTATK